MTNERVFVELKNNISLAWRTPSPSTEQNQRPLTLQHNLSPITPSPQPTTCFPYHFHHHHHQYFYQHYLYFHFDHNYYLYVFIINFVVITIIPLHQSPQHHPHPLTSPNTLPPPLPPSHFSPLHCIHTIQHPPIRHHHLTFQFHSLVRFIYSDEALYAGAKYQYAFYLFILNTFNYIEFSSPFRFVLECYLQIFIARCRQPILRFFHSSIKKIIGILF